MYDREIDGKELDFGVSGLLYRANVLMYDRQSDSLWSQILRKSVAGPMAGTPLRVLPSTLTTWDKWRRNHPGTEVLSLETGHRRDYGRDPYEDYYQSKKGFFSFFRPGPGEEEKALVAGIEVGGTVKAYPLALLRKSRKVVDRAGGLELTFEFDQATDSLRVFDGAGREVPFVVVYWFVWKGMHPETGIYQPKERGEAEKP